MRTLVAVFLSTTILSSVEAVTLSLEAHEIGTGDARISLWETDYGSYDRDFSRSKKILVTLHNLSRKPNPFAVTVYFIAKPTVAPGSQGYDPRALFIYDRGEHAGEFKNEMELRGAFSSHVLSANVQHYEALGVESASGSDMIGWMLLVGRTGNVLALPLLARSCYGSPNLRRLKAWLLSTSRSIRLPSLEKMPSACYPVLRLRPKPMLQ